MDLKEITAQIIREELGNGIGGVRFTGSYEGEEFNIIITLQHEPEALEQREARLRKRVRQLGHDIGIFVEYPEDTISV
jgi:GGDEF domain-containing protein